MTDANAAAPLRRFSHSLIDTMLDCPRKAYYRYVENLPSPKSPALLKGSACDAGFNEALIRAMQPVTEDGVPASRIELDELKTIVESEYRREVANAGGIREVSWGEGEDPKAAARKHLNSALDMTSAWHESLYPNIEPLAVQVELRRTLESGREFIGFLDWDGVWDERIRVVGDNKTGGRRLSSSEADFSLQPFAYAWLLQEPIDFAFARAIDTGKSLNTEIVITNRSAGDIDWYDGLIDQVEGAFVAGNFPPNPKSHLCGPKWCPYFERCMPHRVTASGA